MERTIAGATPGSIEDIRNRRSNLVAINQLSDRPPFSVKDQRLVDYQILTGIKVTFGDQIDFQDAREDALRRKFRNLWLKALCTQITDMPAELQILIFQAAAGSLDKGSQPSSTLEFSIVKDVDLLRGQSPPHNNVFDFEIFNLSAHGAFVAHELAHEIARQSGRSKFSLSLEHVDIEDFLGRDRGLNTRYITLRAADFIHRVECDIWETELEADHEDNFRIWSLLDALLYLPAGKHVMITLLFVRDNSDCLNCGQNCYDGNSRHPHSRPVVELAHLYRKLRPVCERLERISNTGVEVELRWSRYRPLLYGKASPKSLGFCEAVKIVLDAYRAVSADLRHLLRD